MSFEQLSSLTYSVDDRHGTTQRRKDFGQAHALSYIELAQCSNGSVGNRVELIHLFIGGLSEDDIGQSTVYDELLGRALSGPLPIMRKTMSARSRSRVAASINISSP